ncbi:MAG: hypothetical protein J5658_03700 [Prevotella sp.]|nr:hypothetical protein [Prevotella sp.]
MADSEMMSHWGLSPYESMKLNEISSRRPNGSAVTGIVLGAVGTALAVGSWIFAPIFANGKANGVRDLANARYDANNAQLATLANLLGAERAERVAQGVTLTQTVTDTVSGSQQGTLTAQQASELSAVNSVMQQTFSDAITGRSSLNATPVQIYSAPQPCNCPGCGCNG